MTTAELSYRFVILWHDVSAATSGLDRPDSSNSSSHFDLLIEQADQLATWELPLSFQPFDSQSLQVRRLADHRKDYLNYEGPVSGGRGNVSRVADGICRVRNEQAEPWTLQFEGTWYSRIGRPACEVPTELEQAVPQEANPMCGELQLRQSPSTKADDGLWELSWIPQN